MGEILWYCLSLIWKISYILFLGVSMPLLLLCGWLHSLIVMMKVITHFLNKGLFSFGLIVWNGLCYVKTSMYFVKHVVTFFFFFFVVLVSSLFGGRGFFFGGEGDTVKSVNCNIQNCPT